LEQIDVKSSIALEAYYVYGALRNAARVRVFITTLHKLKRHHNLKIFKWNNI